MFSFLSADMQPNSNRAKKESGNSWLSTRSNGQTVYSNCSPSEKKTKHYTGMPGVSGSLEVVYLRGACFHNIKTLLIFFFFFSTSEVLHRTNLDSTWQLWRQQRSMLLLTPRLLLEILLPELFSFLTDQGSESTSIFTSP